MQPYITLTGRIIKLADLPQHIRTLINRIVERHQLTGTTPDTFATEARQFIREEYPSDRLYYRAMRGVVGDVYCDCFYRLHLGQFDADQAQRVQQQLCFNPLRLLLDCYLDDDQTQKDFAARAEVDPAALSRCFRLLLYSKPDEKDTGEISVHRLMQAFQRLGIIPCIAREKGVSNRGNA